MKDKVKSAVPQCFFLLPNIEKQNKNTESGGKNKQWQSEKNIPAPIKCEALQIDKRWQWELYKPLWQIWVS